MKERERCEGIEEPEVRHHQTGLCPSIGGLWTPPPTFTRKEEEERGKEGKEKKEGKKRGEGRVGGSGPTRFLRR